MSDKPNDGGRIVAEMTHQQYDGFMRAAREHHERLEAFARDQAANSARVAEMLAMIVRPPMTDRDIFAGQALAGICAHTDTWGLDVEKMAVQTYRIADAMLAARDA